MTRWTRREFTRNAGLVALFSPFVGLFDASKAAAQAAAGSAQYLLIMHTNGNNPDLWHPGGSNGNVQFTEMNMALSAIAPTGVIMMDGFDSQGTANNHGNPGGLTARSYGQARISVDSFVKNDLVARGIRTQVPKIVMGGVQGAQQSTFFDGTTNAETPIFSASQAFGTLFGGGAPAPVAPPPPAGAPVPAGPSAAELALARRASVLDSVRTDLNVLNDQLRGTARENLQLNIESIRQLEGRLTLQLNALTAAAAAPGQAPPAGGGAVVPVASCNAQNPGQAGAQAVEQSMLAMEVAVRAFACDITRVASVEFGHHQGVVVNPVGAPKPVLDIQAGNWHDDFTHTGAQNFLKMRRMENWLSQNFANTVNLLRSTPAPGGGTLYDRTLIVWTRDMGNAVAHQGDDMPYVFSGGAGGYLRHQPGGRLIRGGGNHEQVLLAIAEGMGVTNFAGFGSGTARPFAGVRG